MLKIFDVFTSQRRYFIVKEDNLIEILKMVNEAQSGNPFSKYYNNDMTIGNCRWVEEPELWFIHIYLTNNQWNKLLEECKNKNYKLVIKDKENRMYFEKQEGSK